DQQCLFGYRMPVPFGVRKVKPIERTPLVFGETPRIISDLEETHSEIEVGLSIVRLKLDGPLIMTNCIIGPALPAGNVSQTVMGLGVVTFGFDHLCKAGAGILVTLAITEGYAKIISSPRKFRLEGDALAIGSNGFVELALLVKLITPPEMKAGR